MKMKFLLAAAMVAVLATSCSEEQTSLTIDEVPGTTKVMGQVFYQTGTEYNVTTGMAENKYTVAAGKKIFVEINNREFKNGAEGITVYEATTDAKGVYEVEMPIASKATMTIAVRPETFTGEMKMFDSMTAGTPSVPVYKTDYVTYKYDNVDVAVKATTTTVKDITYEFEQRSLHN